MKRKLFVIPFVLSLMLNVYGGYRLINRHLESRACVYNKSLKQCVDSWNNSLLKSCANVENIFVGSSSTYLAPTDSIPNSLNLGYWGDKVAGMNYRLNAFSGLRPKRVFVFPSTNGYVSQSDEQYLEVFRELVNTAKNRYPKAQLYVISTFPIGKTKSTESRNNERIKRMNDAIKRQASSLGYHYIDVFTPLLRNRPYLEEKETLDGLHLTPASYKVWLDVIKERIEEDKIQP